MAQNYIHPEALFAESARRYHIRQGRIPSDATHETLLEEGLDRFCKAVFPRTIPVIGWRKNKVDLPYSRLLDTLEQLGIWYRKESDVREVATALAGISISYPYRELTVTFAVRAQTPFIYHISRLRHG